MIRRRPTDRYRCVSVHQQRDRLLRGRVCHALRRVDVRAGLRAEPHPLHAFATRGLTLLDWCEWRLNAGDHGKVARVIGVTL